MIHATFSDAGAQPADSDLVTAAARCWRQARDRGEAVQPCLARLLAARDRALLTPAFDSLLLFYELALGRPIRPGAAAPSKDERLLLALIEGSRGCDGLGCSRPLAEVLGCAVCSARAMLAGAAAGPEAARPSRG